MALHVPLYPFPPTLWLTRDTAVLDQLVLKTDLNIINAAFCDAGRRYPAGLTDVLPRIFDLINT